MESILAQLSDRYRWISKEHDLKKIKQIECQIAVLQQKLMDIIPNETNDVEILIGDISHAFESGVCNPCERKAIIDAFTYLPVPILNELFEKLSFLIENLPDILFCIDFDEDEISKILNGREYFRVRCKKLEFAN